MVTEQAYACSPSQARGGGEIDMQFDIVFELEMRYSRIVSKPFYLADNSLEVESRKRHNLNFDHLNLTEITSNAKKMLQISSLRCVSYFVS